MRCVRRVLVILLAGVACLALLTLATQHYLASQHALAVLTSRLQAAYGGPVQVARMHVGWQGSSVSQVQLYEQQAQAADPPWAIIQDVQADVSPLSLLGGTVLPQALTLRAAAVTLRFDPKGRLVTRLPSTTTAVQTLPAVRLEQGQLTLRQEGRPDMVITGIDATARDQGDGLVLEGTLTDPYWGHWSIQGTFYRTGSSQLTLKTPQVHVRQEMLERLPFVAPKVWQHVQVEGDTPVEFTLRLDRAAEKVHYRVSLEPEATHVSITSIRLQADQARGRLVIEDKSVQLREVRGQTAGGEIQTSGELNFRETPAQLQFTIDAHRLELAQLPKSWRLPSQINGRLTGQAKLQVTLVDGKARTQGEGQGVIHDARIAGLPANSIHLALHAAGSGFRFLLQRPKTTGAP